jgi:streptogramin lyase
MASDESEFRSAVIELLERTPLHGDVGQARRRGERLRRRRRTFRAGGFLSVLIAVVAVVVIATRGDAEQSNRIDVLEAPSTGASNPPSTTMPDATTAPGRTRVLAPPSPGSIEGLAAIGNGAELWLVRSDIGALQRYRLGDGQVQEQLSNFTLPGLRHVALGNGSVFAFGRADGSAGGEICVIDPASGQPVAGHNGVGAIAARGIAFVDGAAWIADGANDRVVRLQLVGSQLQTNTVATGDQPSEIIATGNGELWVREAGAGMIARIDTDRLTVAERHVWTGELLAADGDDSIWAADGGRLVSLTPSALAVGQSVALGARVDADATSVVVDDRFIWVATRDGHLHRYERAVTGSPPLTASVPTDGTVTAMTPAGNALWYSTSHSSTVDRWVP